MNYGVIRFVMGWIIRVEGIFLLLPWFIGIIYKETSSRYFLLCAVVALIFGVFLTRKKPDKKSFYAR